MFLSSGYAMACVLSSPKYRPPVFATWEDGLRNRSRPPVITSKLYARSVSELGLNSTLNPAEFGIESSTAAKEPYLIRVALLREKELAVVGELLLPRVAGYEREEARRVHLQQHTGVALNDERVVRNRRHILCLSRSGV